MTSKVYIKKHKLFHNYHNKRLKKQVAMENLTVKSLNNSQCATARAAKYMKRSNKSASLLTKNFKAQTLHP